ncbi:MAG: peptidoglycan-binding protein [Oscillospiraceae bacterium]|nr:peptidoglycan-binding protein [Oscillospiraceae bacterium]
MGTGYLKIQTRAADGAMAVGDTRVVLLDDAGNVLYETYTDQNGDTQSLALPAPDAALTLDPTYSQPAYSTWTVAVEKEGFVTTWVRGVEVVDTATAILPVNMEPGTNTRTVQEIRIPNIGLFADQRNQTGQETDIKVLKDVIIPDYITVHLGAPDNTSARNVRVRFTDYIKNVVSSEIYPTWPESAIAANVHAIVTFVLNRVYTEWYRSRGYYFEITNSTAYDMSYREGGPVFENISRIVDDIFNMYAHRQDFRNPYFTSFCNGTTVTCKGLAQWGTVELANMGRSPLQILRDYYGSDIQLAESENFSAVTESYPGYALGLGSTGDDVQKMQNYLNRIRVNFPLIPPITNPNGVFGPDTAEAVRAFQRSFNLSADGVIGRATWNKISYIYTSVTRLAELGSEGERVGIGRTPPTTSISQGSRGELVLLLQFILNAIAPFYQLPTVLQDSDFGAQVKDAVIEFQSTFGLTPDGVVGPSTWRKLYEVYQIIYGLPQPPPAELPPYPGALLRVGSTGESVKLMQSYLNAIRQTYPSIPALEVDGIFGPRTQQAVIEFQRLFGLAADGIIGPLTWEAITRAYHI